MAAVGSITGDGETFEAKQKEGVTLHNFPKVLAASLADEGALINDYAQSGKRLGAQVMSVDVLDTPTTASIYVASGSAPTDKWVLVKQVIGTGAADVTPA